MNTTELNQFSISKFSQILESYRQQRDSHLPVIPMLEVKDVLPKAFSCEPFFAWKRMYVLSLPAEKAAELQELPDFLETMFRRAYQLSVQEAQSVAGFLEQNEVAVNLTLHWPPVNGDYRNHWMSYDKYQLLLHDHFNLPFKNNPDSVDTKFYTVVYHTLFSVKPGARVII